MVELDRHVSRWGNLPVPPDPLPWSADADRRLRRRPTDTLAAPPSVELRPLEPEDWATVADIYWDGMRDGLATFQTEVPSWEAWDAAHLRDHRLVATLLGEVVGWAALSAASTRRCYAGVAENSVYVAREAQGLGIGRVLLEALIADAEAAGIWTIQTSIFPENRASLALHERCGFRVVGTRERIGKRDGVWRDTVFLERRSEVIQ
jgi:L-amino acid N-acyltransferase YncA